MNWKSIGNLVLTGLGVAVAAFIGSLQVAGTDPQQAGINAGIAVAAALINHLRQAPVLTVPPAVQLPLILLVVAFGLGGCALQTAPPVSQPVETAGTIGALGCTALVVQASPTDVAKARTATATAAAVLASDTPTFTGLQTALMATDLSPQYRALGAIFLQRLRVHLGGTDPIAKDSPGFAMAEAFVTSCASALGATA